MESKTCALCGGENPDDLSGTQCKAKYRIQESSVLRWTELTKEYAIKLPVHASCMQKEKRITVLKVLGMLIGPLLCMASIVLASIIQGPTPGWIGILLALGFLSLFSAAGFNSIRGKKENQRLAIWMERNEPDLWMQIKQPPEYARSTLMSIEFSIGYYKN